MQSFAENAINIVVSAYFATTQNGRKLSKFKSKTGPSICQKTGPSMLSNIIGPIL